MQVDSSKVNKYFPYTLCLSKLSFFSSEVFSIDVRNNSQLYMKYIDTEVIATL